MRAIAIVLSVAVVVLSICVLVQWMTRCRLTSIKAVDVASIRVTLYTRPEKSIKFVLERELIPDLLAALTPAHYDRNPAKWQVLGRLDIELKDGSRCTVDLYDTYHEFAAFRIDRRYFRGGSNDALKRLLGLPKTGGRNGDAASEVGQ